MKLDQAIQIVSLSDASFKVAIIPAVVNQIGLDNAYVLSFLIQFAKMVHRFDDWFYCRVKSVRDGTTFDVRKQSHVLGKLVSLDLISIERRGVPACRWVKLNHVEIAKLLLSTQQKGDAGHFGNRFCAVPNEPPDFSSSQYRTCMTGEVEHDLTNYIGTKGKEKKGKKRVASGKRVDVVGSVTPTKQTTKQHSGTIQSSGFFKEHITTSKCTIFDYYCANTLFKMIKRIKPGISWRKAKWADEFRILRNEVEQDTDRIEAVLEWLDHSNGDWIKPTSAAWLRRNFTWIEKRVLKNPIKREVVISPRTQEVLDAVSNLIWPDHVETDSVVEFVSLSLSAYELFYSRFKSLFTSRKSHPSIKAELEFFNSKLQAPVEFMVNWIGSVHAMTHSWKEWSGSFKGFIFAVTNKKFIKTGCAMSSEYTGNVRFWFKMMEMLGYGREAC